MHVLRVESNEGKIILEAFNGETCNVIMIMKDSPLFFQDTGIIIYTVRTLKDSFISIAL